MRVRVRRVRVWVWVGGRVEERLARGAAGGVRLVQD